MRMFAAIVLLILTACSSAPVPPDEEMVAELVREFGSKLQLVTLRAPRQTSIDLIREHYAPLITSELLEKWVNDPVSALGRQAPSPWPERIVIEKVAPSGSGGFSVSGHVVETTIAGPVGKTPVRFTVIPTPAGWRISDARIW
jgi:hypothetical protein